MCAVKICTWNLDPFCLIGFYSHNESLKHWTTPHRIITNWIILASDGVRASCTVTNKRCWKDHMMCTGLYLTWMLQRSIKVPLIIQCSDRGDRLSEDLHLWPDSNTKHPWFQILTLWNSSYLNKGFKEPPCRGSYFWYRFLQTYPHVSGVMALLMDN